MGDERDVGRERATDKPGVDRRLADRAARFSAEASARELEFDFERLEDVAGEATRSIQGVTFSGGKNDRAPITERVSAFNITFERTAGSHSLVGRSTCPLGCTKS